MPKQLTRSERDAELAKLDLYPQREGKKRADALLRSMLNTSPDPFTPKPKKAKKRAK